MGEAGRRRWFGWLRFSLRTLVLGVLLAGSGMGLWWKWEPWVIVHKQQIPFAIASPDRTLWVTPGQSGYGGSKAFQFTHGSREFGRETVPPDDPGNSIYVLKREVNEGGCGLAMELKGHTKTAVSARFSPDGQRILTAADDGTARVWDAKSGNQLHVIPVSEYILDAFYSPRGKWIATVEGNGLNLRDARTGETKHALYCYVRYRIAAAFSPDDKRLLSCDRDFAWRIRDTETGAVVATLAGCQSVCCAAFAPDGKTIAASTESDVCIWNAETGAELTRCRQRRVVCVFFFPDSRRLVTSSLEEQDVIQIWDASTGTVLTVLKTGSTPGSHLALESMISGGEDLILRVDYTSEHRYHRRRPEYWWGVAWLPEFWLGLVFGGAFVWSVWRDRKQLEPQMNTDAHG